jgi:hypothetical protein
VNGAVRNYGNVDTELSPSEPPLTPRGSR